MEIVVATERDAIDWDRMVDESSFGTIFHTWKWLKIVEYYSRSKLYPLIGYERENPIALVPLFFQKKMNIKMVFSPPPQTALYYLGPVLIDNDKKTQHKNEQEFRIFQKGIDDFLIEDLKSNYISISLSPGMKDPRPFSWTGYSVKLAYDYLLPISNGIDNQWQLIPKKVRQNINRARKRGISVIQGGRRDFEKIIDIMNKRYREQGRLENVSKKYLLDVYDNYTKNIIIFTAKYDEEILSGVIDVIYKQQLFSWIGNPKSSIHISPSPNDLLIWEEIKFACNNGIKQYVTLSAAGNERLHTYYSSKMNPALQVRFSVKKTSFMTGFAENFYSKILKPAHERVNTFDIP